ncbi:acyloxyacyl hydrolase [Pseudomonas typographi]|uniref:Lipid A deacylase n=1 Tax=Pseudomonas typographi TaxID=2715964 RepID=A0ABR7YYX5_9PSED|nr:acyloxyacyl hydrolase [Pseudomonas typographi]MBD1550893.1 acyloxyacyl hydrolase [Pseudomonas typographi]MBD1589121.1 acyloxyacyl hydrolase [Pseudomonas typographi]MBD1598358.1 acyloxyacyl hydrolase [Pseudomonas typographi]
MKRLMGLAALAALAVGYSVAAQADGLTFSAGETGESTQVYRLGYQIDWDKSWWQTGAGRLTGYWDAGYTYWDGDDHSSNNSISFAPVFRYEFGGGSVKPFVDLGIGVALFSQTQIEDKKLGSSFNFEDRLGLGVQFAGGHELSIRAIHYSNAGIKEPNDGIEAYSLNYKMPL